MNYAKFIMSKDDVSALLAMSLAIAAMHDRDAAEGPILDAIQSASSYDDAFASLADFIGQTVGKGDSEAGLAASEALVALTSLKRKGVPYHAVKESEFIRSRFSCCYVRQENGRLAVAEDFGPLMFEDKETAKLVADFGNALMAADRRLGGSPVYDVVYGESAVAAFRNEGWAKVFMDFVDRRLKQ